MEEKIILTERNCHRADKVRSIENPELGEFNFEWRGKRIGNNWFKGKWNHILTDEKGNQTEVCDHKSELAKYEVLSWKCKENFEDLWDCAVRAYSGTSFDPDERGAQTIREYEAELQSDIKDIKNEEERDKYIQKYKEWVQSILYKHSRILSPMITGPARFPTQRNEKANSSYAKALNDFKEWREKTQKAILKRAEAAKSPEEKDEEEWVRVKNDILRTAETLNGIDKGTFPCSRPLIVANLYGRMETIAKSGNKELLQKATNFISEIQSKDMKKPIFTTRHKFWKLQELCELIEKKKEDAQNKENVEIPFDGGVVVKNFAEDRLQIFHDNKPSYDVINLLKANGFRWSRFNGCWQRQLTHNSYYGAARVLYGNDIYNEERTNFINQLQNV